MPSASDPSARPRPLVLLHGLGQSPIVVVERGQLPAPTRPAARTDLARGGAGGGFGGQPARL